MDNNETDSAAVRIPPPLVFLGAVITGAVLHAFVMPVHIAIPVWLRFTAGITVALPALLLLAGALGLFWRTDQNPKPWKPTPEIISNGVYRFTRNPMYLGMALLQIAIGIGLANGWIIIVLPLVLAVVYTTAIRHEEIYLQRKFGDVYNRYRKSVRRWL